MLHIVIKNVATKVGAGRSISAVISRSLSHVQDNSAVDTNEAEEASDEDQALKKVESERLAAFRKQLKEDIASDKNDDYNVMNKIKDDPLPPWPNNTNPITGEIGGPKGPEPTRYGDWERKGIAVDF